MSEKLDGERVCGKKVKVGVVKEMVVGGREWVVEERDREEYGDGRIWGGGVVGLWKERVEYVVMNVGCEEGIEVVMGWVGVRIFV